MTDPKNCIRHYEWVEPGTLELALPTNRLRLYFMEEGLVRCRYSHQLPFLSD